jgi:hypothetical protein
MTVRGAEDTVPRRVINDRLLVPVDSAGGDQEEERERASLQAHGRSVPEEPSPVQEVRTWG